MFIEKLAVQKSKDFSLEQDKDKIDKPQNIPSEEKSKKSSYIFFFAESYNDSHDWPKKQTENNAQKSVHSKIIFTFFSHLIGLLINFCYKIIFIHNIVFVK